MNPSADPVLPCKGHVDQARQGLKVRIAPKPHRLAELYALVSSTCKSLGRALRRSVGKGLVLHSLGKVVLVESMNPLCTSKKSVGR